MTNKSEKRKTVDVGTPAVDLNKRVIDLTAAELVELVDARLSLFLDGESKPENEDGLIDRAAAAKFLSVSTAQIDKLCREQSMPHHRVGDHKRFDRDELRAWVKGGGK